jgi:hypothetical protein
LSVEPPLPPRSLRDRLLVPLRIAHVLLRRDRSAWHHLLPWLSSLRPGVDPLSLGLPWLTFGAIEWLEKNVRANWRVLEIGSGGSTLFFRRRVRELVSIEHDRRWYDRVGAAVPAGSGFTHLFVPDAELEGAVGRYPERHFDLVFIDGGADRVALVLALLKYVAPRGALMLDNSDGLLPQLEVLARHSRRDFYGVAPWNLHRGRVYLHTTSVWRMDG